MKYKITAPLLLKIYIAFLTILLIPIVVISGFSNANMRNLYTEIIRSNMQNSLHTIMDITENALDDAEKIVVQLTFNDKLKRMWDSKISDLKATAVDVYAIRDVLDSVADIVNSNKNIESVYIYNKNDDYIITSDKRIIKPEDVFEKEWINEYMNNLDRVIWLQSEEARDNGVAIPVISALYPIANYSGLFNGVIVVNISQVRMLNYVDLSDNSYVFISSNDKRFLSSISKSVIPADRFDTVINSISTKRERQGAFFENFNKRDFLISYSKSSYNNWYYVSANPVSEIYKEINRFTYLIIIIALVIFVCGLIIAYFLSKKFYNPVKRLVEDIKKRNKNNVSFKNEWKYIEGILEETIKQDKKIEELLMKDKLNTRVTMLKQILSDAIDNWDDYYFMFPYQNYTVIIIDVDDMEEFVKKYSLREREYICSLVLRLTTNTINSQIGYASEGYYQDNSVIIITNSELGHIEENEELFKLIRNEIQMVTNCNVSIAIGVMAEAGNVSSSFNSAKQALNKRFFVGYGKTLIASDEKTSTKIINNPFVDEKAFFNNLKLNQFDRVCGLVEQSTQWFTKVENQDYEMAMQTLLLFVASIVKYLSENNIPMHTICTNNKSIYSDIFHCDTIKKAEDYICSICEKIISFQKISSDADQFKERVLQYVHEKYKTDIDVYTMAYDLNISYSQLRRIFIEYTGENIVSYTNKLRIEKAKEMLVHMDKTIIEISLEIGYNNDQSFTRYFKKFEGITPGEYRKSNQEKQGDTK